MKHQKTPTKTKQKSIRERPPHDASDDHYAFVHFILRRAVFYDPISFFERMQSPEERKREIRLLWEVLLQLGEPNRALGFTDEEIRVTSHTVRGYPALVIEMPPPRFQTEAHLVCLIDKPDFDNFFFDLTVPEVEFFTLEKASNKEGDEGTVLCSWTESKHTNYGIGCKPNPADFLALIKEIMKPVE